ncbi:recombinase family protein, partial [Bacillus sp. S0628]|uniref:recombinase family protein n=1 Tax=Bacillus sp. S0628 TaxID=2957802 RepID=UPI0032093329|nr:hypothetical protein [Bacillus sp. S0628]
VFNIMSAFAEFERDMIVERTQEGKSIAKLRPDFRDGRPNKYTKKQIKHALELLETNSYKQVEQLTGISKSTLIRAKKKQNKENTWKEIDTMAPVDEPLSKQELEQLNSEDGYVSGKVTKREFGLKVDLP